MSSEAFHSVEAPFTEEEVKIAVFELGGDHTPTPDGFFVIFFFPEILRGVMQYFICMNSTRIVVFRRIGAYFITLILKKGCHY